MTIRLAVLSGLLATTCGAGLAQDVTPSVAIGTHVLTIGMSESTVLEELGTDLELKYSDGSWMVLKRVGQVYDFVGDVTFTGHRLTVIERSSTSTISNGKSALYALYDAAENLQSERMTNCHLSTKKNSGTGPEGGTVSSRVLTLDCGVKTISLSVNDSHATNVLSDIEVTESLRAK